MWGFAWMFWFLPVLLFLMVTRHWRREHWRMAHRGGHAPWLERELDDQRGYVDALERRVADLEERLDFTERLLANRAAPSGS